MILLKMNFFAIIIIIVVAKSSEFLTIINFVFIEFEILSELCDFFLKMKNFNSIFQNLKVNQSSQFLGIHLL